MGKILIIEDDKTIRKTLVSRLERLGHVITEAQDGRQGLDRLTQDQPELILLDLVMPSLSGFEFLEEMRMKLHLDTPVLIISNLDQKTDIETAKNLGAADYILKSNISLQDLSIKVNHYLTG